MEVPDRPLRRGGLEVAPAGLLEVAAVERRVGGGGQDGRGRQDGAARVALGLRRGGGAVGPRFDAEGGGERIGRGRVPGLAEPAGEDLHPVAAAARLGELEGEPAGVGGVAETARLVQHDDEPVERVGRLGPAAGHRQQLGAAAQRGLVARAPASSAAS